MGVDGAQWVSVAYVCGVGVGAGHNIVAIDLFFTLTRSGGGTSFSRHFLMVLGVFFSATWREREGERQGVRSFLVGKFF